MSAAEALEQTAPSDPTTWLLRPYMPESADDEALYYMLGISYTRSRAGMRAGAYRAGRKVPGPPSVEDVARQKAFMAAHRPVWTWLLANANVTLAVDPEAPHIIWAWLISTDDVVHAVGCKRSLVEAGLSQDIVRDLLGERLTRHQVCSLELPQMRSRGGTDAIGIDRPKSWSLDPTWLLTRMGGLS